MTPGEAANARQELEIADDALRIGRLALGEGVLRDATSRLYYAAFHAARATLTIADLHSRTHSGLINLFRRTYGEADLLDTLLDKRARADYSIAEFDSSREDVDEWARDVERFIARCRRIVEDAVTNGPDEPDPPPDL